MRHADKAVTIYQKEWNEEKGVDVYRRTALDGVSFFSRVSTSVYTDGLAAACEGILRIPAAVLPNGLTVKNGDIVCEGIIENEIGMPFELNGLCQYVFTVVGVTRNTSGKSPHLKVVCK